MKGSVQNAPTQSQRGTSSRRRWLSRLPLLAVALFAVVVGVAAGAATAMLFFSPPENNASDEGPSEANLVAPADSSAEAGFARDMVVHHAQAVQMAEIVRDRTESEEIRTLAADIALTQQAQIGQMQGWLQVWGLSPTSSEPAMSWMGDPTEGRMPGMASPEELNELQQTTPENADILFLQLMIPHHKAAIPMANAVLEETDRPEVKQLATAIAASQEAEVRLMQELLQRRGAAVEEGTSAQEHTGPHGGE